MDVWNPHLLSHKMDMLQNMVAVEVGSRRILHQKIAFNVAFIEIFQVMADLEDKYLTNMIEDYNKWMNNAIKLEVEDWSRDKEPDPDADGAFR